MGLGKHISWDPKISAGTGVFTFHCILPITWEAFTTSDIQATTYTNYLSIPGDGTQATQVIPVGNQSWQPLPLKVAGWGIKHKYHHLTFSSIDKYYKRILRTISHPFKALYFFVVRHIEVKLLQVKVGEYWNLFSSCLFQSYSYSFNKDLLITLYVPATGGSPEDIWNVIHPPEILSAIGHIW